MLDRLSVVLIMTVNPGFGGQSFIPAVVDKVKRVKALIEGVQDRVVVETGDVRKLPFADATFDVVVSSLAIHNISSKAGRAKAISEAWRVLKPGGRLAIADIRATRLYAETLSGLGATDAAWRRLGWRFWWGNPMASTTLLTASKPRQEGSLTPLGQPQ